VRPGSWPCRPPVVSMLVTRASTSAFTVTSCRNCGPASAGPAACRVDA
jgi:hypothetical protein